MSNTKAGQLKQCSECGKAFYTAYGQSKYCPECAVKVRRQKTAERTRRWRARMKEAMAT